jgi:amylosucrase
MYEQVSHSLLNRILDQLKPEVRKKDLRHFYTRLGANFYAIHSLFHLLYGKRDDFQQQMVRLVEVLAVNYIRRDDTLKRLDESRERDHTWFLNQQWVGMALYANAFAGDLQGLVKRLGYLQELGVNLLHVMPILQCPPGASDGGYAVSDYRNVDPLVGDLDDLRSLANGLRHRGMLLALDVVVNHVSDQHDWARQAREGAKKYQDYFYVFPNREIPDMFEETSPGNFTWDVSMQKWVMTVFNHYQWDLNYGNPAVFIEMLDVLLFWANRGADILRLDAVAFLWKKIGTTCQNEHEAHLILQLLKDCCQVTAPGVLFIAEAIVAPVEIIKYFGRGDRQGMRDRLQRDLHGAALGRRGDQERPAAEPGHPQPAEQAGPRHLAELRPLPRRHRARLRRRRRHPRGLRAALAPPVSGRLLHRPVGRLAGSRQALRPQ